MDYSTAKCHGSDEICTPIPRVTNSPQLLLHSDGGLKVEILYKTFFTEHAAQRVGTYNIYSLLLPSEGGLVVENLY